MKKRNNLLVLSLTLSALLLVGCTTDQQAAAEPAPVESTKIMELTENAQTTALVHTDVKDAEDFVPPVKEEAKQDTPKDSKDESKPSSKETKDESKPSSKENTQADTSNTPEAVPSPISEQTAKDTALTHAGVSDSDASFVRVKLDREDGRQVYEVEFYDSNYTEYDYEIDALTGNVLDFDWDAEDFVPPVKEEIKQDIPKDNQNKSEPSSKETKDESKPSSKENTQTDTSSNQKPAASVISDQQAKEIAVAQVPGATIDNIREFEADRDDGRLTYEGSLHLNGVEYEFEIDGASGSIISWEIDD